MGWIQTVSGSATSSGTQNITVTAGNAIVAVFSSASTGATITVSDGQGTYTKLAQLDPGSTATIGLFVLYAATGGTHTLTLTGHTGDSLSWIVSEYSGFSGSITARASQVQFTPGTGVGAITPGNFSAGSDIVLGVCVDAGGSTTIVTQNGTSRFNATVNNFRFVLEDSTTGVSPLKFTDATNGGTHAYYVFGVSFQTGAFANLPVVPPKRLRKHPRNQPARPIASFPTPVPLTQCNAVVVVLQVHHPSGALRLNQDTSRGMPKPLFEDVQQRRIPVIQNQVVRRDVIDTSHGTPLELLLAQAPPTGPPFFALQQYPWLPDDTTQATPLALSAVQVQAPFQNAPAPVPPLYPGLPDDTSQAAQALLSGDFFVPTFNPSQFQIDAVRPVYDTTRGTAVEEIQAPLFNAPWFSPQRFWWQPADASQSTPKTLYADAVRPAFNPPHYQVDQVRPVYDTSHGTPAEEIQPPIANPEHFPPVRFWWQPPDCCQATPKTLYADLFRAAVPAPTLLVDTVRPVADTSRSSPLAVLTAQAPFTAEPGWAPIKFWWQPADTSQAIPKPLYADALAAIVPPASYQVDRLRPVTDTTQSSPVPLTSAAAPFSNLQQPAPPRFWWQPQDTSAAAPKPLYSDALTPVFDTPQFQVDRVRPVVDTSLAEPKALYADQFTPVFDAPQHQVDRIRPVTDTSRGTAIEEIQAPLANAPWFAPQRYPWLPADTCQSVPKTLYADLFRSFFNPPPYQIDPVRPVYDTSRGSPAELAQAPVVNPPHFAPLRFWWQPADTSGSTPKPLYADLFAARVDAPNFLLDAVRPVVDTSRSTPTVLIPVQAPFVAEPWCPPLRFFWQPADASQSTAKVNYADLNRATVPPPSYQVDRVRPVTDTSQSAPLVVTAAPVPFQVLPHAAPARYWWQPADSSQATPKALYGDLNRAVVPPPGYQIDAVRPVADTSRGSPDALIQAPPTFTPPPRLVDRVSTLPDTSQSSFAALHPAPLPPTGFVATPPYVWLPADTTRGTPSIALLPAPVVNAPQFQVDSIRPVYDTSRGTQAALLATVTYPFLAQPWQAPLRFWWQPVDTSQSGWPPLFGFVPGNPYILVIESRQIDSLVDNTQTFMVIPSRQIGALIDPVQTFTICQEE
jgi:hypothetical protein